MSSYYFNPKTIPDCANCKKANAGNGYSTSWNHGYPCCSDRCGKRLAKRIENGMYQPKDAIFLGSFMNDTNEESLRNRIRQLKNQLKRNGIKPV